MSKTGEVTRQYEVTVAADVDNAEARPVPYVVRGAEYEWRRKVTPTSETASQRAAWDAARVTDPNPPDYDGPPCRLPEAHVLPGHIALRCSRQRGHTGQHVATDWYGVLAVWSGEAP